MERTPLFSRLKLFLAGLAVLLFFALSGIQIQESIPSHAWMVVDDTRRVYMSPRCFEEAAGQGDLAYLASFTSKPRTVEMAAIRGQGYKPEPKCRDAGGLVGAQWGPLTAIGAWLGLLERPTRFNGDGTWKW